MAGQGTCPGGPVAAPTGPAPDGRAVAAGRSDPLPWVLVAVAFGIDVVAWYPGAAPFDTAFLWWQVRGGESNDVGSPALLWVWRGLEPLLPGPAPILLLHLALFWTGIGLLLAALRPGRMAAVAIVAASALAPLPLLLRGAVLTDTGMAAGLACAFGALAMVVAGRGRRWLALLLPAAFYAFALRHNALPAVLPPLAVAAAAVLRPGDRRIARIALATLLATAVFLAGAALLRRSVDRQVPLWPSLAQFDLAALSIASGELLLPPFSVGPGLTVAELGAAFRPWSNTPMLQGTQHGLSDPLWTPWRGGELAQWRQAWFAAIAAHPAAYAAHRLRVGAALFGTRDPAWPRELAFFDGVAPYRDNPEVAPNRGPLHRGLVARADAWRATPALAAWPYLAAGLLALPLAWARRRRAAARLALALVASALLYAAPLVVIAPAAEVRYLAWPCVASLLALLLAATAWRADAAAAAPFRFPAARPGGL